MRALLPFLVIIALAGCGGASDSNGTSSPISPPVRTTNSPVSYGVNETWATDPNYAQDIAAGASLQATWVRGIISATLAQPTQSGPPNWSISDAEVNAILAQHEKPLMILFASPPYNTTMQPGAPLNSDAYPPANDSIALSFITSAVTRYKGMVAAWEIYNEPDLDQNADGSFPWTPTRYAQFLAEAYQAVKTAVPNALVVMAATGNQLSTSAGGSWLQSTMPLTKGSFDVANIHQYGPPATATQQLNAMQSILQSAGLSSKPVWVTEVGASSVQSQQRQPGYQNGLQSQEQYMCDLLTLLRANGASAIFWYDLYDAPFDHTPFSYFGVLNQDRSQKPSFGTLQRLFSGGSC